MALDTKNAKDASSNTFAVGGKLDNAGAFVPAHVTTDLAGNAVEIASETTLAAVLTRQDTALTALGAPADAVAVSGNASIIAALKGMGVAVGGAVVTPSDSADLSFVARSLWVGGGGDLKLKLANGDIVAFANIPEGTLLPFAVLRVYATGQAGSIASSIVALK
jgi:hypothetical protein